MKLFYKCDRCGGPILPFGYYFTEIGSKKKNLPIFYMHPRCFLTKEGMYNEFLADPKSFIWQSTSSKKEKGNMLGIIYWAFAGLVGLVGLFVVATKAIIPKPAAPQPTASSVTTATDNMVGNMVGCCFATTPNGSYVWPARSDNNCYIEDCKICK